MYAAKLHHHRRPLLYVISGTCYLLATLFPRLLSPAFWHSGRMESLAVKYAAAERNSTKFVSHCRCTRRIKLDMFVQIHSSRETRWKERRDAFTIRGLRSGLCRPFHNSYTHTLYVDGEMGNDKQ